jgi:hypothetical protein
MEKSMYQISTAHLELMSEIEEAEGVLTDEMVESLKINKEELQVKSKSYYGFIRSLEADSNMVKDEIARLTVRKKRSDALATLLKERLLDAVILHGDFRVGTLDFKTRKSQAVIIEDEEVVPKAYMKTVITTKVDKALIKKAIKGGTEVRGAILQDNLNLAIK